MKDILIALIPVVVAVFGSTGFWSYMQTKKDKTKEVLEAVNEIKKDVASFKLDLEKFKSRYDENEALNCRNRLVRFADELRLGKKASLDMMKNSLKDADRYEQYCDTHPNFENSICTLSIKLIKEHYEANDYM